MSDGTRGAAFGRYIEEIRGRFAFLERRGYGAPRVSATQRECTVVYWGNDRANVALYNDSGGAPWVQIVPLSLSRADGSTRTFGLNEAIALLDPAHHAKRPNAPASSSDHAQEDAWLQWYATFLADHFDEVLSPTTELLAAIEGARSPA